MNRMIVLLPALLAVTGCGRQADETAADDRRGAEGEVLGGTISDAMLPLHTVRSQSPPLRESPAPRENVSAAPEADGDATDTPAETSEPQDSSEAADAAGEDEAG